MFQNSSPAHGTGRLNFLQKTVAYTCVLDIVSWTSSSPTLPQGQEQTLPPDWHFGKLPEVIQRSDYCTLESLLITLIFGT
ncbi:hypothetical protein GMDG_06281 [Pseudogymnoascus destructans 20631-21]|uniref:Uncharacterized protein n=1 Tax=Pseudogymnoascus destructans (strain ATCC MYA-4855 / 20631-21) TaxID=658429 RepID=L8FT40_PSED2|nr:hypothetical protein GMDG_06281 [Pseudogymnoascus destructans 20631-21]